LAEVFDHIFVRIDNIITILDSFQGNSADLVKMRSEHAELRNAMDTGNAKIKSTPSIEFADVIHIGGPLFVLEDKYSELVEAFHSKKAELEKAGARREILKELQMDKVAADALGNVVKDNLPFPALLGMISGPIGKVVTAKLEAGIKEWS
jgi:hypothetical protein